MNITRRMILSIRYMITFLLVFKEKANSSKTIIIDLKKRRISSTRLSSRHGLFITLSSNFLWDIIGKFKAIQNSQNTINKSTEEFRINCFYNNKQYCRIIRISDSVMIMTTITLLKSEELKINMNSIKYYL